LDPDGTLLSFNLLLLLKKQNIPFVNLGRS
jgi:hypothetical protein